MPRIFQTKQIPILYSSGHNLKAYTKWVFWLIFFNVSIDAAGECCPNKPNLNLSVPSESIAIKEKRDNMKKKHA